MDLQRREQARVRKQRQRDKEKAESVTSGSVTGGSVTFFKEGVEMVRPLGTLPARPRYLTLSDGVLDRANPPKPDLTLWPGWKIQALRNCTGVFTPLKGRGFIPELRRRYAVK